MDFQFHCSQRANKVVKKSKHRLSECCYEVMQVLALNPNYGVEIPQTEGLRKMRVRVPSLKIGKSGGYRLIYKAQMIDETWKIALLTGYFKGDCEDLTSSEYKTIREEADLIFSEAEDSIAWQSFVFPS